MRESAERRGREGNSVEEGRITPKGREIELSGGCDEEGLAFSNAIAGVGFVETPDISSGPWVWVGGDDWDSQGESRIACDCLQMI